MDKGVRIISAKSLIQQVHATLHEQPYKSPWHEFEIAPPVPPPAAYTLIVGAGFSHPVIPLAYTLVTETIGNYYYPDQDMSSLDRSRNVSREDSASFWRELDQAASDAGLPRPVLGRSGLPHDAGAAYRYLFEFGAADALFAPRKAARATTYIDQVKARREPVDEAPAPPIAARDGERFLRGFLRYVMDPGGHFGYGSTGRTDLNDAHIYLSNILEAQQSGIGWDTVAFCRTVFTTNFDTLLQNALQMVNLLYTMVDRPERGLDRADLFAEEGAIHLVYTHGSILRHNPANTDRDIDAAASRNSRILRDYLRSRDVIAVGYSGWNDGLMAALAESESGGGRLYWCDVRPEPPVHVEDLLAAWSDRAAYVNLGHAGADGLMRGLWEALVGGAGRPDPRQRLQRWRALRTNG